MKPMCATALIGLVVAVAAASRVVAQAPVLVNAAGCPPKPLAFHACALQKARTFEPPRTPGGRPNLQGHWRSLLTQAFSVEGVPADDPLIKDPVMPWFQWLHLD